MIAGRQLSTPLLSVVKRKNGSSPVDSKQFNKRVDDVFDAVGKASDERNTVDRTTCYIGVAQTRALLAVIRELRELREALENRCVITPAASADLMSDHAAAEPRHGRVPNWCEPAKHVDGRRTWDDGPKVSTSERGAPETAEPRSLE